LKPLVSVVLPVRNGGTWLRAAVDSILGQTLTDFEMIVVDDHSTDEALRGLAAADPRLRVLSSPGRGVSHAFNAGFAASSGRFVSRMDADDIALPNRLERQVRFLEGEPGIDICGACVEIFVGDGATAGKPAGGNRRYQAWLNACRSPDTIHRELFIESPIPNPTAMFRREALTLLEGYRNPAWPEDYDLFLRADSRGMQMGKPDEILLRWRDHGRRLTRSDPRYAMPRFQAAKAHYLAGGRLRSAGPVVIWGAGPTGRSMHDLLRDEGVSVRGFLDVHPRRVGGRKRDLPVWPIEHAAGLERTFVLVAVGAAGARGKIRRFMQALGRTEGSDFLFVA
jgi:glycosyltransferase involved in cell wall biosynthesis